MIIPLVCTIFAEGLKPLPEQLNALLVKLAGFLLPLMLVLLGVFPVVDATLYLTRDEGTY